MKTRLDRIIRVFAAFSLTLFSLSLQAQMTDAQRQSVSAEIAAAIANYHQVFSTGTPAEMAEQIYGAPLVSVSTDGSTTVWSTTADVERYIEGLLISIRGQGWYRSQMPSPSICVLGPNSGFASGQFIRYREDGSEISRSGMAYVFQKKPEGWRMTTFLAHEGNIALAC